MLRTPAGYGGLWRTSRTTRRSFSLSTTDCRNGREMDRAHALRGRPTSIEDDTRARSARMTTVLWRGLRADACKQYRRRASDTGQQNWLGAPRGTGEALRAGRFSDSCCRIEPLATPARARACSAPRGDHDSTSNQNQQSRSFIRFMTTRLDCDDSATQHA